MKQTEQTLEESVAESPPHEFVPFMSWPQPVAVTQAEGLSADLGHIRLLEHLYAQLLKIVEAPYVVVALEKADLDTGVHQVKQGREHPHIAFRNDIVVLVPEVPDVPQEVQCLRPVHRNGSQEPHKAGLPVGRVIHVQPEMDIRNKVNKRPFRHDPTRYAKTRSRSDTTRQ